MSSILHVKLEMVVIQAWQKNIMSLSSKRTSVDDIGLQIIWAEIKIIRQDYFKSICSEIDLT